MSELVLRSLPDLRSLGEEGGEEGGEEVSQTWQAPVIQLNDGRILVFEYT